jgi:hypothetical protein
MKSRKENRKKKAKPASAGPIHLPGCVARFHAERLGVRSPPSLGRVRDGNSSLRAAAVSSILDGGRLNPQSVGGCRRPASGARGGFRGRRRKRRRPREAWKRIGQWCSRLSRVKNPNLKQNQVPKLRLISPLITTWVFTCSVFLYADRLYDDVDESSSEESSDPPNPLLHRPYIPDELADRADIRVAFREAMATFEADKGLGPLPLASLIIIVTKTH